MPRWVRGGGGVLAATAGEALEVGPEEGDLGEGKGEGADLLGAQAVLEGVEVALGGTGAGSFAAPGHSRSPFCVSTDGRGRPRGVAPTGGRGKQRPYAWAGASPAPTGLW